MALTFPGSPTIGQTYSNQGKTWQYNGTGWSLITGLGPGIVLQSFTSDDTYIPAVGMKYCTVLAWGSANVGDVEIVNYNSEQIGANADIVIGDGAGSNTSFNPEGTGSTLVAEGATGSAGKLYVIEFVGESYGSSSSDQHAIGDIAVTFDATVKAGHVELDGSTITDGASDYPILAARYSWMVSGNDIILPDTRGRTLRGWDHGAGVDPNAATRTARAGDGATGDNPGTNQGDAMQGHRHAMLFQVVTGTNGFPIDNGGPGPWSQTSVVVGNPTTDGTNGTPRIAPETRMTNINVTYQMRII